MSPPPACPHGAVRGRAPAGTSPVPDRVTLAARACRYLATGILLLPLTVSAQSVAQVEALQVPAWVERQGARVPAAAGMLLEEGDRLSTGSSGRLLLRLTEGSQVRLGERARFEIAGLEPARAEGGIVRGLLRVASGAFRFTTSLVSARYRRELDIQVATVTAGIRGTDIWGKSTEDRDIVCLIEGRVTVQRAAEEAILMEEPLSFYIAPRGKPALPVQPVPAKQLQEWAEETDLTPGAGTIAMQGDWAVSVASYPRAALAQAALPRWHDAGLPVRVVEARAGDRTWYRIGIVGLESGREAAGLARRLDREGLAPGAWAFRTGPR